MREFELSYRPDSDVSGHGTVEIPEAELTRQLFGHLAIRSFLFQELGLTVPTWWRLQAVEPFANGRERPGDIDVLAFASNMPHRAVALEVKRVKVRPGLGGAEKITKAIGGLREGVDQANALARLGFSRTYLMPIIVADVRGSEDANFLSTNASTKTLQQILDCIDSSNLNDRVGLFWIELPQATNRGLDRTGKVNAAILRPTPVCEQTADLTQRLQNYSRAHEPGR